MKPSVRHVFLGLALSLGTLQARAAVCFFTDQNFTGNSFCMTAGQEQNDLQGTGWNDKVSSIQFDATALQNRVVVTVCTDRDFGGTCEQFTNSVQHLGEVGINDQVSSIRLAIPQERPRVCYYSDANYGGQELCVEAAPAQPSEIANLVERAFNDKISSIRIFGPLQTTVWWDVNFSGKSLNFAQDIPDLQGTGWNDQISSLRVSWRQPQPPPPPPRQNPPPPPPGDDPGRGPGGPGRGPGGPGRGPGPGPGPGQPHPGPARG